MVARVRAPNATVFKAYGLRHLCSIPSASSCTMRDQSNGLFTGTAVRAQSLPATRDCETTLRIECPILLSLLTYSCAVQPSTLVAPSVTSTHYRTSISVRLSAVARLVVIWMGIALLWDGGILLLYSQIVFFAYWEHTCDGIQIRGFSTSTKCVHWCTSMKVNPHLVTY